jgi:hypothetical protein
MEMAMTDVSSTGAPASARPDTATDDLKVEHPQAKSGASGWVTFAAVVMIIAGVSRVFDAVWAFQYHRVLPEDLQGALFGTTLNVYGWIWLFVGAALILVGLGYLGIGWLAETQAGRWAGVVAAGIGAITAMSWMAYYPVWTILYFAVAVLVIYALIVHPATAPS